MDTYLLTQIITFLEYFTVVQTSDLPPFLTQTVSALPLNNDSHSTRLQTDNNVHGSLHFGSTVQLQSCAISIGDTLTTFSINCNIPGHVH